MKFNKLTASEGMVYTNGEAYGKTIYLGANDSAENWYEIPYESYEEKMSENKENTE